MERPEATVGVLSYQLLPRWKGAHFSLQTHALASRSEGHFYFQGICFHLHTLIENKKQTKNTHEKTNKDENKTKNETINNARRNECVLEV